MWSEPQNDIASSPAYLPLRKSLLGFASQLRQRTYLPRQTVLSQGDRTAHIVIIVGGWAEQAIHIPDGRRQIVGFGMAGDVCCCDLTGHSTVGQSITALTSLTVAIIGKLEFSAVLMRSARLSRAFWRSQMQALAIQRRWTSVIGLLGARERVAHLLCELYLRQQQISAMPDGICAFPLTQTQVAEACGLTQVHTNRVIQDLRRSNLIEQSGKRLTIPSLQKLMTMAQFEGSYLGLEELNSNPADVQPFVTA
jgi:CRP-like cAMP-binding protein